VNRRLAGFWLVVAALACLGAGDGVPLPAPTAPAWAPLAFRSIDTPTEFRPAADSPRVLEAESRCGASARVLPLEGVDLSATPILEWRWRVLRPLAVADERIKAGDDFAARVYVMFEFETEGASLFERARRRLGSRLYGMEMPGAALSFVWTSGVAPGESWTSPYTEDSKMVALADGSGEAWRTESVDVEAAFRRAFDREPPRALALGIMSDADNACQHALAQFADFRFAPAAEVPAP
jgi:hypothetical protein